MTLLPLLLGIAVGWLACMTWLAATRRLTHLSEPRICVHESRVERVPRPYDYEVDA